MGIHQDWIDELERLPDLDCVSPRRAFVLGAEWVHAHESLTGEMQVQSFWIHEENAKRVQILADRHGVTISIRPSESIGFREVHIVKRQARKQARGA